MKGAERNKLLPCFEEAKPCINPEQFYWWPKCVAGLEKAKAGTFSGFLFLLMFMSHQSPRRVLCRCRR